MIYVEVKQVIGEKVKAVDEWFIPSVRSSIKAETETAERFYPEPDFHIHVWEC